MADESPYRAAPKTELVVDAGASPTMLFATVALGVGLYGLWHWLGLPRELGWVAALIALAVTVPLVLYAMRRKRWRFTLERRELRVEHLLPSGPRQIGALDVSAGVGMRVDVPDQDGSVDARMVLSASGEQLAFFPGARTREAYVALASFLREHDVAVEAAELPKLPGERFGLPKL